MKGILADLLIKLGLDSKGLNDGIDKAKAKTNAFADGIKRLGLMMAGAFSVAAITAFVKSAIAAGKEAIKVENELGAAIRANGKDVDSNLAAYKAFASQLQRNSTVEDETTLSLIRLAETMQSKAPMEAAKNAVALSKALGVDLNTATKMAVLAQSGLYSMLERYTPSLRQATDETAKAVEYNKLIASGLSMVSAELQTAEGRALQASNAWGGLKERLGVFILQSDAVSFGIRKINEDITISNSSLKWYEKWWYRITLQHGKGAAKAVELAEAQEKAAMSGVKQTGEFQNLLSEINVSAEEYNKRVKEAYDNWDKNNQKLALHRELIDSINDSIADYENKIKNFSGIDLSPKVADTSGITSSIQMFPLSDEKEENIGFDTAAYKKMLDEFEQFKNEFANLVVDFGVEVVDQFGQAIGTMIADGKFPDDFGKNVLAIIGGFISQLGKMLIGLGVASEAFQLLLKSAFTNPVSAGLAIAAGAALVLLGGAIQGAAKAGPTGSSSSGGGSISSASYSNSSYGGSGARAENNTVEFVIKGNTLVGVLNNQSRKNGLIG